MKRLFVRSKLHRVTVTGADINYEGSISIDPELMRAAGIEPFEFVHINNVRNGVHWETYVIPGGPGDVVLNGPPAHLFDKGDKVVVWTLAELEPFEIHSFVHTVVFVDQHNRIEHVRQQQTAVAMPPR